MVQASITHGSPPELLPSEKGKLSTVEKTRQERPAGALLSCLYWGRSGLGASGLHRFGLPLFAAALFGAVQVLPPDQQIEGGHQEHGQEGCLLYTSDAADE